MTAMELSRRRFLLGAASLGSVPLLASCVGSGGGETGGGQASATITLQSSIQDTAPKAALEEIVAAYQGAGAPVTLNAVAEVVATTGPSAQRWVTEGREGGYLRYPTTVLGSLLDTGLGEERAGAQAGLEDVAAVRDRDLGAESAMMGVIGAVAARDDGGAEIDIGKPRRAGSGRRDRDRWR